MKNLLALLMLTVFLSACGKSVNTDSPNPPIPGPGTDDGSPLPPPTQPSGYQLWTFANHATNGDNNNEVTEINLNFRAVVILPNQIIDSGDVDSNSSLPQSTYSFDFDDANNYIEVNLDGDILCRYVKSANNEYQLEVACKGQPFQITYGSSVQVVGFPRDTVNLQVFYQKN